MPHVMQELRELKQGRAGFSGVFDVVSRACLFSFLRFAFWFSSMALIDPVRFQPSRRDSMFHRIRHPHDMQSDSL